MQTMKQSMRITAACGLLSAIWVGGMAAAGKPLKERPVTVTFRCAATVPDSICPANSVVPDGIRGDGASYAAVLDSTGELFLALSAGGARTLWLDFRNGPGPSCPTCRRDFDTLFLDDVVFHTNVVDSAGVEVAGGLTSIPVGGTSASRVKVAFNRLNNIGQTVQWGVRFNPEDYPGSDHVTVRHTSLNTWEVEAYATDMARLPSSIARVRNSDQNEGPFYMPFKIVIVAQ